MKRRWHRGSFKQNRNIRWGKDIVDAAVHRQAVDRVIRLDTAERIREYEEDLLKPHLQDEYDHDDYYVYHSPDEDFFDDHFNCDDHADENFFDDHFGCDDHADDHFNCDDHADEGWLYMRDCC